jgi:hypothetical protein
MHKLKNFPLVIPVKQNGMPKAKVRGKWQRQILGMSIYATFGMPLYLMLPNYVPNGNIVFHGIV